MAIPLPSFWVKMGFPPPSVPLCPGKDVSSNLYPGKDCVSSTLFMGKDDVSSTFCLGED